MTIRLRSLVILLLLGAIAAAAFFWFGIYNISAVQPHTAPVYKLLETGMQRAVKRRAGSIEAPADLSDRRRIENGLVLYREYCLQCHGAPGVSPGPLSFGMQPAPANLVAAAREWTSSELYWLIRNGVKMSGMPAWEYRMTKSEIWDTVAFVMVQAKMSPLEYQQWSERIPQSAPLAVASKESYPGNAEAGKRAMHQYLCATCHYIPGVVGASRHVGPPLAGFGARKYIAGIIPNTPENLVPWLQNPKAYDPLSGMPALGISDRDARDMAAYLTTLQDLE